MKPIFKSQIIRSIAHVFMGVGDVLQKISPFVNTSFKQSGIGEDYHMSEREYVTISFLIALFSFMAAGSLTTLAIYTSESKKMVVGPVVGIIIGSAVYMTMLMYPQSIVRTRIKYIERNLLFALRTVQVQIRSGVPIFNSIASVAAGDYGPISDEFKNVVEKVNSGKPMVDALEELAIRNPSLYFRRALWQLVNAFKSGSDVGDNLTEIINSVSKDQLIEIRRYKSVLNPLAMMYMMSSVILPSLGITLLIILSSFPGMERVGEERVFWGLLVALVFMQFVFMGLIKSRRPNLIGG